MNYWAILKKGFNLTLHHPELWLLGLFLSGGFNTNIFYWANLRLRWREQGQDLVVWLQHNLQAGPHWLLATLATIIVSAVIVIVANWIKTAFVLYIGDLLQLPRLRAGTDKQEPALSQSFQEGRQLLLPVITLSLFTMVIMIVLATILGGTPKLLFASRGLVWLVAGLVFLALVFLFSCLNIFGTFYIVLYRQSFARALNLARDLIVSRWANILEMAIILMVIYGLCFFVGSSLLFWGPPTILGILVLWFWLGLVNTFFNVCLLLLFTQLVKPPYHPEFKTSPAPTAGNLPEPASFSHGQNR